MNRILDQLGEPTLIALRCKGADWGGSLLAPQPIPDKWMGLLIKPDGRRWPVPSGDDPRPGRADTLVLVRNQPLTTPLVLRDAASADSHVIHAEIELLLRCPYEAQDLAALHAGLLTGETLTLSDLEAAVVRAGGDAALGQLIREHSAAELTTGDLRAALLESLRAVLQPLAFTAGLTIKDLGRIRFESPTLAAQQATARDATQRVEQLAARSAVEQAALAATRQRLAGLDEILSKLQAAAAGDDVRWRALLPALTPGERGRLLANLWRLTPHATATSAIILATDVELAWLSPATPDHVTRRVALPRDLGGLRSVTAADDGTLLVGAARGIWHVGGTGEVIQTYVVPDIAEATTGFNAAMRHEHCLYATHSQLGAWQWSRDEPAAAQCFLRPHSGKPRTIRGVQIDGSGHVLLAADDCVRAFDPRGTPVWQSAPAGGQIQAVAVHNASVYVCTNAGVVAALNVATPERWGVLHRIGSPSESLQVRQWDDLCELVVAAGAGGVLGLYDEEGLSARLLEPGFPVRRAWAADDLLVALSHTRDRLALLGVSAATPVEVPIARLLGRTIQDAALWSPRPAAS